MTIVKIDDLDQRIISVLRKDAKAPIREIAQITKTKTPTVHQRIQRLVASGIIERYTLKLNSQAIGEGLTAILLISTQKPLPAVAFEHDTIKEAFAISGEFDHLIKLKCRDLTHLNQIMIDLKNNYPLQSMQSIIAVSTIKEEL